MKQRLIFTMALVAVSIVAVANAADSATEAWQKCLQQSAFVKEGLDRFHNPQYECECLGLGGTVLRVGPDGFTRPAAVAVDNTNGAFKQLPYLSYQYWWDEAAHRHLPFDLTGGYGQNLDPGQVMNFRQELDLASGLLTIELGLKANPAGATAGHRPIDSWHSRREMFITPEGVLVLRVTEAPETPLPFQVRVDRNQNVRIYLNGGIYAKPHDPWTGSSVAKPDGLVVVAHRPQSCIATLAIAVDGATAFVDPKCSRLGSSKPGKSLTFYLAPGSSYESADPVAAAWLKAEAAKVRGFEAARRQTARWWQAFYARSAVCLPDSNLAKWFARSTYYLGVFFGNTDVPPGCYGTGIEGFCGAVCPEYDLVLDQLALLYGNHFDEARRVVGWLGRALPRTEQYAKAGLTLHQVSVKYSGGAKFGPLMGYDGTILTPPTVSEGTWAYEDFAGNNAALMALDYVDWSGDGRYDALARRILQETTLVSVEDLQWRPDFNAYLNRNMPATLQQAGTLFGLRESVRRGVAEKGWAEMAGKILLPTADYQGTKVFGVGPGYTPVKNSGDATWLSPLWYYSVVSGEDPLCRDSYALFRTSKTGDYVFNNGWMGVIAAKLHDGAEASRWAKESIRPGFALYDDTCFTEIITGDGEDFKKTPEVAAHGSSVCNLTQMLLEPDDSNTVTVFPAIPIEWERSGVAFKNLAAKGDILVSAEFATNQVRVTLDHRSDTHCTRNLRVRLPKGTTSLLHPPKGVQMEDGWAVLPAVHFPGQAKMRFAFTPSVVP